MNNENNSDLDRYMKSISGFKRVSKDREIELLEIITTHLHGKSRDNAVRELVEANLLMVVSMAKKKANHGADIMDLIYSGNLALWNAANKYSNKNRNNAAFSTCAYTFIHNAQLDTARDRWVYLPKIFNYYEAVINNFEAKNGGQSTPEDIASLLDVTLKRAKTIKAALNSKPTSTESIAIDGSSWEELIGERDLAIKKNMLKSDLSKFLKRLSPEQRKIIELTYLNEGLDCVEAAKRLGCSKQWIDKVCRGAMRDLKACLIREWDGERKTKTLVMDNNRFKALKVNNNAKLQKLIEKEDETNRRVYKEVLAHYLG